jgi:hypothetical protein
MLVGMALFIALALWVFPWASDLMYALVNQDRSGALTAVVVLTAVGGAIGGLVVWQRVSTLMIGTAGVLVVGSYAYLALVSDLPHWVSQLTPRLILGLSPAPFVIGGVLLSGVIYRMASRPPARTDSLERSDHVSI